eukprot:3518726-Pyramimonas_sp.AAC.1
MSEQEAEARATRLLEVAAAPRALTGQCQQEETVLKPKQVEPDDSQRRSKEARRALEAARGRA